MNFHSVMSVRSLFNRLVTIASVAITLAFASSASAVFHTYRIEQIYSNADGTVQFIVMHESQSSDGENLWGGHVLTAQGGGVVNSFTFPNDLPSSATSGTRVLIATEGFAALGVITSIPCSSRPSRRQRSRFGSHRRASGCSIATFSSMRTTA